MLKQEDANEVNKIFTTVDYDLTVDGQTTDQPVQLGSEVKIAFTDVSGSSSFYIENCTAMNLGGWKLEILWPLNSYS